MICRECKQETIPYTGGGAICGPCHRAFLARGLRWCQRGMHLVNDTPAEWESSSGCCRACKRARNRSLNRAPGLPDRPEGWLHLTDVARRLGLSKSAVVWRLSHGWPVRYVRWSRYWFVEPRDVYPPYASEPEPPVETPQDDDPEEWGEIAPRVRPEPSHDATAPLAREGSTVYTVVGNDVYYSVGGSLPRVYCSVKAWPQSHAAKRLAEPGRRGMALWEPERGLWGWIE